LAAYVVNQADALVKIPSKLRFSPPTLKTSAGQLAITTAFDNVCSKIKQLEGFPLEIVAFQSVSAGMRGTSTIQAQPIDFAAFPVKPTSSGDLTNAIPPFVPVHDVVIQVEASNAWPDDYQAVLYSLAAMYSRLGQLLRASYVVETTPEWLDVLVDGFVFRFRIQVDRRLALLARRNDETATAEATQLRLQFEFLPLHAGGIRAFSQQHTFFTSAVRIAQRWVAAHLLADEVPFEVVECLVAYAFKPTVAIYSPPASALAGFHRFLELLAKFDFAETYIYFF